MTENDNRGPARFPTGAAWRKSSRSNGDGNVCVEVAFAPGWAAVRDSKNPRGAVLVVPATSWQWLHRTLTAR